MTTKRERPRLLVADDDEHLRPAIVDLLLDAGLNVVAQAADGAAAVEQARESSPDVVIMDMRMPGMTGIEAATIVLRGDPLIEVIMLTAYADPTLRALAGGAGIGEYLVKGDSSDLLIAAIDRAWGRRQISLTAGRDPSP